MAKTLRKIKNKSKLVLSGITRQLTTQICVQRRLFLPNSSQIRCLCHLRPLFLNPFQKDPQPSKAHRKLTPKIF